MNIAEESQSDKANPDGVIEDTLDFELPSEGGSPAIEAYAKSALVILAVVFVAGLWHLNGLEQGRGELLISQIALPRLSETSVYQGNFVASSRGSKYYRPWCTGAKKLSENNLVWFDTKEAAVAAGYAPAKNCRGVQ